MKIKCDMRVNYLIAECRRVSVKTILFFGWIKYHILLRFTMSLYTKRGCNYTTIITSLAAKRERCIHASETNWPSLSKVSNYRERQLRSDEQQIFNPPKSSNYYYFIFFISCNKKCARWEKLRWSLFFYCQNRNDREMSKIFKIKILIKKFCFTIYPIRKSFICNFK